MPLQDPPLQHSRLNYRRNSIPPGEGYVLPGLIRSRITTGDRLNFSAWASAANPFSTSPKFAVGFSGAVSVVVGREDHVVSETKGRGDDRIHSVDWLDHNTIISGGRQGKVILWDTRSSGESTRFHQNSQINHIRMMDGGTRIAIADVDMSIKIQDLRMLPRPGLPEVATSAWGRSSQEPYMTFRTVGGPVASHLNNGFDVQGDLIAAATADCRVQLFNVRTGREVVMTRIQKKDPLAGQARCIRFGKDESQTRKLYVASCAVLQEWSWA